MLFSRSLNVPMHRPRRSDTATDLIGHLRLTPLPGGGLMPAGHYTEGCARGLRLRTSVSPVRDRRHPGTWRTRVITKGVDPQISCSYRSSRIKQYFKERRALRTETVVHQAKLGAGR